MTSKPIGSDHAMDAKLLAFQQHMLNFSTVFACYLLFNYTLRQTVLLLGLQLTHPLTLRVRGRGVGTLRLRFSTLQPAIG